MTSERRKTSNLNVYCSSHKGLREGREMNFSVREETEFIISFRRCIMNRAIMLVMVFLVMGFSVANAAVLKLDFNNTSTAAETEEGFTSFTIADIGSTVNGVTVGMSATGSGLASRRRGDPTGEMEQIMRDFIFANNGAATITLSGLTPNRFYVITMYSFDTSSTQMRNADWTANGEPLFSTIFDGADIPNSPDEYKFTGTGISDDTGTIVLAGTKGADQNAAQQHYCFMNALIVERQGANDPSPADGEKGVADTGDVILSWNAGLALDPADPGTVIANPDITKHYLYMDGGITDPNIRLIKTIPADGITASHTVTALGMDETYRWTVEESINDAEPGDPNNIVGPIWSFKTRASVPEINTEPSDQAVLPGTDAVFTVGASSITELTYTWYKSADDIIDGTDIPILRGVDRSVLTIAVNADTALAVSNDQAYYYCILDNGSEETPETQVVFLKINREIAHYAFDGNGDDSSVEGNNGVPTNPLQAYSNSLFDRAAVFTDDPNYIDAGLNAVPSSDPAIGGALEGSASYWIKTTSKIFGNVYGTFNRNDNSGVQLNINEGSANGRVRAYIRGAAGSTTNIWADLGADSALFDGEWHHLAFTWSSSAGEGMVYFDGEAVQPRGTGNPQLTPWEFSMAIGARTNREKQDGFLDGELDELIIYNYPLTKTDVYDLFLAGPADSLCDAYPEYDWNRNCIVDLADFAIFAAQWLECGRYPVEACE